MLVEEIEITFSNLLSQAVGTPEAGAVNFNFLYELLLEIINHLGISEKLTCITQEVDYRNVDPSPHNQPETVASESRCLLPPIATEKEGDTLSNHISTPLPTEDERLDVALKPSIIFPEKPLAIRHKSSIIHKRAISARGSLQPMGSGQMSAMTGSGENVTKSGEMWHVLNINRRVETAEAAIEGLTGLFDSMNRALDEIRNRSEENTPSQDNKSNLQKYGGLEIPTEVEKTDDSNGEHLNERVLDLNSIIDTLATKDDIKGFCNTVQVKEMIDKNLMAFKHTQPQTSVMVAASESPESVSQADKQDNNQTILDQINALECDMRILKDEANGDRLSKLQDELNKIKEQLNIVTANINLMPTNEPKQESNNAPNISHVIEPIKSQLVSVSGDINGLNTNLDSLTGIVNSFDEAIQLVKKDISGLLDRNDTFSETQKDMCNSINKLKRDIENTMDNLQNVQTGTLGKKPSEIDNESALTKVRGTMYEIQEKHFHFQNEINSLSQDGRQNEKDLKEITLRMEELEKKRVDKEFVRMQVESKADKNDLANTLTRDQFDHCINGIDRNIQNMLQDMQGADAKNKKNLTSLQEVVDDKLSREEAMQIRGYIDSRFKSFKPKIQQVKPSEDCAAGTRKRVMPDCNCISCDRPVDVPINGPCPALPYYHALPNMKSIRPVTTFELQTIRQHMQHNWVEGNKDRYLLAAERVKLQRELLQLCGAHDLDSISLPSTNRPCGGVHTLGQHRKNPGKPPMFYREDQSQFQPAERQRHETNVVGKDGHVYKGRKQLHYERELPDIRDPSHNSRSVEVLLRSDSKSTMETSQKADIVTVLPTIQTA